MIAAKKVSELSVSYNQVILSPQLNTPEKVFTFLKEIWDMELISLQEQFYAIFLNSNNEVISWRLMNTGTSSESLVDIKLTLSCALSCMASKIIVAHNHPSGALQPSTPDLNLTDRLRRAAALLDIKLVEHLIINREKFFSFSNNRYLGN